MGQKQPHKLAKALPPTAARFELPPIRCVERISSATKLSGLSPATEVPEIAFAGRSNAGKSTLLNRLVGKHKLARTSATPGCTRAIEIYQLELKEPEGESVALRFMDLPGYGYADRSHAERGAWGPLMDQFFRFREGLAGVLLLSDVRRDIEDAELDFFAFLNQLGFSAVLVLTKCDKLSRNEIQQRLSTLKKQHEQPMIAVSADTGQGITELWRTIRRLGEPK